MNKKPKFRCELAILKQHDDNDVDWKVTGLGHSISYKITCAISEGSDQPGLSRRLSSPLEDALEPWLPTVSCEDSDQTVRMHRLT